MFCRRKGSVLEAAQSWKQHSPGWLRSSATGVSFSCQPKFPVRDGEGCCCLGSGQEHITVPQGLPAQPYHLANRRCTSLSICSVLRVPHMLRRGQSNMVVAASKGLLFHARNNSIYIVSQRKGGELMPISACMVSSELSDCCCRCPAALASGFTRVP